MDDIVEKVARAAHISLPDAQAALDAIREEYAIVPREADHDITGAVVKPGEDRTWAVNAYRAMIAAGEVR